MWVMQKTWFKSFVKQNEIFHVPVTHFILRLTIVQNKFQQAHKTKINHINDNHIKFEVSLDFLGIWPTVRRSGGAWTMYIVYYDLKLVIARK